MRRLLAVMLVAFVAGCSGGDEATTSPETTAADGSGTEFETTEAAVVELPPLVSVPVDAYTANHVNPPVSFETSPSTGGDHYTFWQNCGFYTVPVIEGGATHTLEHGAVWITYNQSLMSSDDLAALESLAAGNPKLLISPYDHDDAIVLSAWGVQQRQVAAPSTDAGSTEINSFISAWVDNPELPEAGVTCSSAVGVPPNDVRSFPDGEQVPDEYT